MSVTEIGEKIKAKRRERGITQQELADILGVTKAAVSKWETAESYPDITTLPRLADLFHMTMDELFGYHSETVPIKTVSQYSAGFSLDDIADKSVLNHGSVKECRLEKRAGSESEWEVRVNLISTEEDFPKIIQKCMKPGRLIDAYSCRIADGKSVVDDKPNKHYICREKIWEYNISDRKYMAQMLREQLEMGLIDGEDEY